MPTTIWQPISSYSLRLLIQCGRTTNPNFILRDATRVGSAPRAALLSFVPGDLRRGCRFSWGAPPRLRTSLPRQQTLPTMTALSYDLPTASEHRLLRRPSALSVGTTLPAGKGAGAGWCLAQDTIAAQDADGSLVRHNGHWRRQAAFGPGAADWRCLPRQALGPRRLPNVGCRGQGRSSRMWMAWCHSQGASVDPAELATNLSPDLHGTGRCATDPGARGHQAPQSGTAAIYKKLWGWFATPFAITGSSAQGPHRTPFGRLRCFESLTATAESGRRRAKGAA